MALLSSVSSAENSEPIQASLIQLIASPEKYDGKLVEVIGFTSFEFEDLSLYLSENDHTYFNKLNSVNLVNLPSGTKSSRWYCHMAYCIVVGKFQQTVETSSGPSSGSRSGYIFVKEIDQALNRHRRLNH